MRNTVRWQRTCTAAFSTLAIVGVALAVSAAPATARPVDPAPAGDHGTVALRPQVSKEAWAAGRAKHGPKATAEQAIAAFWTPARMKAAKPAEESKEFQAALRKFDQSGKSMTAPDAVGPAISVPPAPGKVQPKPVSGGLNRAHNPNYGTWHPTARTVGKVFYKNNGFWGSCSGAIVNSEGKDTVWTAGHCVHSGAGGVLFTDWMFIPAYDIDLANAEPHGRWFAVGLWTRTAWVNSSDFTQDMAVAIMGTRNGWHIVDYFGGHGFRANWGINQWINSFGYPSEYPFSGGHLWQCWGSNGWEWAGGTSQIPCDMNRGSSGGPWLHGWDGNWGYLNGVNSRVDRLPWPTVMRSPYFDNDALSLYDFTRHM